MVRGSNKLTGSTSSPASRKVAAGTHDEHRFAMIEGELLDAQKLSSRQEGLVRNAPKGNVWCPVCKEPLVAKMGEILTWHFAHRADSEYRWHEAESKPHLKGKRLLREHAERIWPQSTAREEWRLPEIRQIADVLVRAPGSRDLALELQYADLAPAAYRARHQGYTSLGIADCWILGHTRLRFRKGLAILDGLASTIIASHQPLLYLNPSTQTLTHVRVAPAIFFRASRGERIGQIPAQVIKAPLAALRFDGGTPYFEI